MLRTLRKQDSSRLSNLLEGYRPVSRSELKGAGKKHALKPIGILLLCIGLAVLIHPLLLLFPAALLLVRKVRSGASDARRVKGFDRDYAAFLISLASSIKAGSDPLAAVISSRSLFPEESVITEVLVDFETQIHSGASELEAIQRFGLSVPHPDLPLFRLAFALARREGSSLADCLHRLSRVTRNRQSFRRKISAAVAMQKFSAFGISGCSLIIVSMQFINNSESFLAATVHESGRYMIGAGFALILMGLFWMMRVAKRSDI